MEPTHLDLEKLFLLSVSKENLDFRRKIEKNLPYKISKFSIFLLCWFFLGFAIFPIIPFWGATRGAMWPGSCYFLGPPGMPRGNGPVREALG